MTLRRLLIGCSLLLGIAPAAAQITTQPAPISDAAELRPADAAEIDRTPLADIRGVEPRPPAEKGALSDEPELLPLYAEARELLDANEYVQAAQKLENAIKSARGDYFELAYSMALAKFALGSNDEARQAAEHAATLRPGDANVHYLLGQLYERTGEAGRAIAHYRSATLADPYAGAAVSFIAAWARLADLLAQRGSTVAALEAYEEFDRAIWETFTEYRADPQIAELLRDRPYGALEQRRELLLKLGRAQESILIVQQFREGREADQRLTQLLAAALLEGNAAEEALELAREQLRRAEQADSAEAAAIREAFLPVALNAARNAGKLMPWLTQVREEIAGGQSIELGEFLARTLTAAGDFSGAADMWRALLDRQPANLTWTWEYAQSVRQSGDLEAALRVLMDAVRADPKQAEIRGPVLDAWLASAVDANKFLELLAEYEKRPQRDFAEDFVLGTIAAAAGQADLAGKLFERSLLAQPDFALARVAWGRALLREERWAEAKQQAEAALKLQPDLPPALFVLGSARAGLDETESATQALLAAAGKRPDNTEYLWTLGRHLRRQPEAESTTAAQRWLQQALATDPTNQLLREELIESYVYSQRPLLELARQQVERARLTGADADSLRRMATIVRFGIAVFDDEHVDELAKQWAAHPNDFRTGLRLAAGLLQRDAERAAEVLKRVVELDPRNEDALLLLATASRLTLQGEQAIAIAEGLLQRFPNRANLLETLALAYGQELRLEEARAIWRKLIERPGNEALRDVYFSRLVSTHALVGEFDEAFALCAEWAEAVRENSANEHFLACVIDSRRTVAELEPLKARIDAALGDNYARTAFFLNCLNSERIDLIESPLQRALATDPADKTLLLWKALVLALTERGDEAAAILDEPGRFETALPELYQKARAHVIAHQQGADAALEYVEKRCAETTGSDVSLHSSALDILEEAERGPEALKLLDVWVEAARTEQRAPDVAQYLGFKARLAHRIGDDDAYLKANEALLSLALENLDAFDAGVLYNNLAYGRIEAGQALPESVAMARKAVMSDPSNGTYLDTLGWAYYKNGDFAQARAVLRKTVRYFAAQDTVVFDHLGDAEFCAGDRDAALKAWRRAVEVGEDPGPRRFSKWEKQEHERLMLHIRGKIATAQRNEDPAVASPGCK